MQLYIQNMKGCKDFFLSCTHIVEQQMTFFVKRTILCLEFGNLY